MSTFFPNKSFDQLLNISARNYITQKHLVQSFYTLYEVWFTDQIQN